VAGGVYNALTEEIISPREIAAREAFKVMTGEIISPREIVAGGVYNALTEEIISQGESPRLPRSDKQEEPKCIFGPSVLTPTSYASCSIRIGAYAGGVLSFDLAGC
jgi:hypothetical protein